MKHAYNVLSSWLKHSTLLKVGKTVLEETMCFWRIQLGVWLIDRKVMFMDLGNLINLWTHVGDLVSLQ